MRHFNFSLIVFLIVNTWLFAQVPNAGFENWTGGEPDNWVTNNSAPYITVTQSNSGHSGSSALKGEVINYIPPFLPVIGPYVICEGDNGDGFAIASRFNSLKGFYKFNPQGGDKIFIEIFVSLDTTGVGIGSAVLDAAASYTEFAVPIYYVDPATPNLCIIYIQILNPNGGVIATLGSEMYLDDFQLSMDVVSVEKEELQPISFRLDQNYPNPFNPSTTIDFSIPQKELVSLRIFNSLGEEVAELINETKNAGNYAVKFDASQLSSGIYFYVINAGNFIESRKMILLR